jgi:RNA polymerase sigma factor (sigma-70 family)
MNGKALRIRLRPDATDLVQRFVAGDDGAIDQIVSRYYGMMLVMADRLIRGAHLHEPDCDCDDAVNTTLFKLYQAARTGKIALIETGDDFWRLFRSVLKRTILHDRDRRARLKRGGPGMPRLPLHGRRDRTAVAGAEAPHGFRRCGRLDELCSHRPPPEESAIAEDEIEWLLDLLNDPLLRRVAMMRAEELTNREIAQRLGLTTRSIRRKVAAIRQIWSASQVGT